MPQITRIISMGFLSILLLTMPSYMQASQPIADVSAQVYFSPDGGCTDAIVKEILRAKSEILLQAYIS